MSQGFFDSRCHLFHRMQAIANKKSNFKKIITVSHFYLIMAHIQSYDLYEI